MKNGEMIKFSLEVLYQIILYKCFIYYKKTLIFAVDFEKIEIKQKLNNNRYEKRYTS